MALEPDPDSSPTEAALVLLTMALILVLFTTLGWFGESCAADTHRHIAETRKAVLGS